MSGRKMRDSRHKFKQERFRLVMKKSLFPMMAYQTLSREVMQSPLLDVFKSQVKKNPGELS